MSLKRNGDAMSEENGKVCCNCRHNVRAETHDGIVSCKCDINNSWLSYITVMTHWCRHWSKDRELEEKE